MQFEAEQQLTVALRHHQQGDLEAAEKCYRQVIRMDPRNPDALYLLGSLLVQRERYAEAKTLLTQAVSLGPSNAMAHNNLGSVLQHMGNHEEALMCYERALELQPTYANALNNVGYLAFLAGDIEKAQDCYRRVLEMEPDHLDASLNLGALLLDTDATDEAITHFEQLACVHPHNFSVQYHLGLAYQTNKQHEEALVAYAQALELNPLHAMAHNNRGVILHQLRRFDQAIQEFQQAIQIDNECIDAYNNLGNALSVTGRPHDALKCLQHVIARHPNNWQAWQYKSSVEATVGKLDEAAKSIETAAQLSPDEPVVCYKLGIAYALQGRVGEAIANYRKAVRLKPEFLEAHSSLLLTLHYDPACDERTLMAEHLQWAQQHTANVPRFKDHPNDRASERKLRIGYVSPDFRGHSVAYFIEPILANHDPNTVETFCYAQVPDPDSTTARLRQFSHHWRDISDLSDAKLAEQVRADGIDILVDLAGHTAHHRLLMFARKPAPIQITYLGYPNTTGLKAVDYRFTDTWADPLGQDIYYREALVRLPLGFLCYAPPRDAPSVCPLPAAKNGYTTYGSFNTLAKINTEVVACWAKILASDPDARLLLKNKSFQNNRARDRYSVLFEQHGVDPKRVEMMGWTSSSQDHLSHYQRIDIALDTFPYNGATTTCEALWMGVPVITLVGDRHAGRVGLSLLSQLGLERFATETTQSYVQEAVRLSADFDELAELRAQARARMNDSPLRQGREFTNQLEQTYRQLWCDWCSGL